MSHDEEQMLVCAVRYAQGRMTYVVGEVCRWVRERWTGLSSETRAVLYRDLRSFLDEGERIPGSLGMEMDAREWRLLEAWMRETSAAHGLELAHV